MAKVTTETIKKEKTIVVEEKVYNLQLTEKEAKVLYFICGNVLGSFITSPRKYTSRIYDALQDELGLGNYYNPSGLDTQYDIYFADDLDFCLDD